MQLVGENSLAPRSLTRICAAGEPARVVIAGLPEIHGVSMAEKRREIMDKHDDIRKILLLEPRGYPCQNADLIFPSSIPGVAFGYVIMEQNKIYPLMSGIYGYEFIYLLYFFSYGII